MFSFPLFLLIRFWILVRNAHYFFSSSTQDQKMVSSKSLATSCLTHWQSLSHWKTNSENYFSNKILFIISTFGMDTIKFILTFDTPMIYELLCYKQLIFFVLGMMKMKLWGYTRLCSTKYTSPCVQVIFLC